MNIKKSFLYLSLIITSVVFSQEDSTAVAVVQPVSPKISVLDSIKKTFIKHDEMTSIDSLWMKELSNQQLCSELFEDIAKINIDEDVAYDLPTNVLKDRLKKLDAKSPFNIEYNKGLENMIKALLKNRKKSYERLYSISKYYFPMFEDALAKYNIPLEIKYLAIVESALNPRAKSKVGATGLWQFMYGTGIQYNLDVNSYIDERSDPLKATEAACKYLSGMYTLFGDWDLVLASYNCGPGNVTKAIRRSGGLKNYWNIRKNLPQETAGYVPAFLATMYIFEYHKEHGIAELKAPKNYLATDTILVKREISFKQISKLLDIPIEELQFLNPSYKMDVIPYTFKTRNYLRLPVDKVSVFTSNEDKIYYFVNYESNLRERPFEGLASKDSLGVEKIVTKSKFHKVRKGENLDQIAKKYSVTSSEIKKWNKLKTNSVALGKKLKIVTNEVVYTKAKKSTKLPKLNTIEVAKASLDTSKVNKTVATDIASNSTESKKSIEQVPATEKVINFKEITKKYKVVKGDNIFKVAEKFSVSKEDIKKWNKLKSNKLPSGKELKIITNEKVVTFVKTKKAISKPEVAFAETTTPEKSHEVKSNKNLNVKEDIKTYKIQKGDNINAVANKFNVSVKDIKNWNNLKSNKIAVGASLKIILERAENGDLKKDKKDAIATKTEIKEAKIKHGEKDTTRNESLYLVQKGDNLNSISKKHNVSIAEIKEWNNLENDNIALGSKLIVSKPESNSNEEVASKNNTEYIVEKGDNVWNISKRFNVTLAQLKEWNNLDDNTVQIGTKLIVAKTDNINDDKNLNNKNSVANTINNTKIYHVKKGDSLFSISKKYPGVSVSDLKKWNDIDESKLKPGMKLKING